MLALKFMLIVVADLMFVAAFAILVNDVWLRLGRTRDESIVQTSSPHWKIGLIVGASAWLPLLLAMSIAQVAG